MLFAGRLFNPSLQLTLAGQVVTFINGAGLRVTFDVSRNLSLTPDAARVQVYNLAEARRTAAAVAFQAGLAKLTLAAGFDGVNVGIIRNADIRSLKPSSRSGADILTTADADDGGLALDQDVARVPLVVPATAASTMQYAFQYAMTLAGGALVPSPYVEAAVKSHTTPFSYVGVSGNVGSLLERIARDLGVRWYIQDGVLHAKGPFIPLRKDLAVIVAEHHLMSDVESDGAGITYWTQMLDPNVVPGRTVTCLGVEYEVQSVVQRGDTHGGPWSTRVAARIPVIPS